MARPSETIDPVSAACGAVLQLPLPPGRRVDLRAPQIDGQDRKRLRVLRRIARDSCLAARPVGPPAHTLGLEGARSAAERFRAFLDAADRRIACHPPEERAVSSDEQWLLRLIGALTRGDMTAAGALIAFRIPAQGRQPALAAAAALADYVGSFDRVPD